MYFVLALASVLAALIAFLIFGTRRTLGITLVVACGLLPFTLLTSSGLPHVGISSGSFALTTYSVSAILGGLLIIFSVKMSRSFWLFLPFLTWLTIGALVFWDMTPELWSGVSHLLLAPCSWIVGIYIFRDSNRSPVMRNSVIMVIGVIIGIQLVVSLGQLSGFNLNSLAASQEQLLKGRQNGTLGHPNDLGKVVILLVLVLLPMIDDQAALVRRKVKVFIAAGFLVALLTGGRAVIFGFLIMLCLWVLLARNENVSNKSRFTIALGVLAAALFSAGVLLGRFDEDPVGGGRSAFLDVAWYQITIEPLLGVGPNGYVTAVGQYDALTASGVPVHNAFLLGWVELGLPGVVALVAPILLVFVMALVPSKVKMSSRPIGICALAFMPVLYLLGTTGWGLLGGYVFPLLYFVMGFTFAGVMSERVQAAISMPSSEVRALRVVPRV